VNAELGGDALPLALIHGSAWKKNSQKLNFRFTAFSEVHYLQATLNRVKVRHLLYRHAVPPPQYLGCYTKRVRSRTFLPPRRVE
jgi:hypothetical protein